MIQNTLLLIVTIILSGNFAIGQPINKRAKVTWGKEMRATKRSTLRDVVGHDETGAYAIRFISKGLYGLINDLQLEHYDPQIVLFP